VPTETSADFEMTNIYIVINLAAIFTTLKKQCCHVLKSLKLGFSNQSSQYYNFKHMVPCIANTIFAHTLKNQNFRSKVNSMFQSLLTYNIVHWLIRGFFFIDLLSVRNSLIFDE